MISTGARWLAAQMHSLDLPAPATDSAAPVVEPDGCPLIECLSASSLAALAEVSELTVVELLEREGY